jgi:hypothetical protein
MAGLKVLPLIGAIAFLLLPESAPTRARTFACAITGFLAVNLLNAILFSRWLPSYFAMLVDAALFRPGRAAGGAAGGAYNPDTIHFVIDGLGWFGLGQPLAGFVTACLGLGVGYLVAVACRRRTPEQDELPSAAAASLVVLVLWLFLFRQKNYAFETFVPFMVAAGYGVGQWTGRLAILASLVVTAACFSNYVPIRILNDYAQLVGVWAAVLVLLLGAILGLRRPGPGPPAV